MPRSGFPDVAGNAHESNIACVAWYELAHGSLPGAYAPARSVRRDQMASFLARALDRGVDDGQVVPREAPDTALTDVSTLHVRGVGLAEVGMTLHEVEQRTGTQIDDYEHETFGRYCYYAQPEGVSSFWFLVVSPDDPPSHDPHAGVVARASSSVHDAPRAPTMADVRPGDSRAAVVGAHGGGQLTERPHIYQPDGAYLDLVAADGEHGFRFEVNGSGVVEAIHAGDAGAVTWPEGCA
jgi:hypothetical protein